MFLSSYKNTSQRVGKREIPWEDEPQASVSTFLFEFSQTFTTVSTYNSIQLRRTYFLFVWETPRTFAKNKPDLPPLMACGNALEVVDSAKLLGVTITSNLTWNLHVAEVIKKASKRLYFLLQLKRAHVPKSDLVTFYTSCVRSVCDYAVQVFHSSLPLYLINDLERVQKRVSIHT